MSQRSSLSSDFWPDSDQNSDVDSEGGVAQALLFPPEDDQTWAQLLGANHSWKLCFDCRELLKVSVSLATVDWEDRMFKTNSGKIRRSRDGGCKFCDAIIRSMKWANLWQDGDQTLFLEALNPSTIAVDKTKWTKNLETVALISTTKQIKSSLQDQTSIPPSTLSFITKQLTNCLTNPYHNDCGPSWDAFSPWPARMLEISNNTITLVPFNTTTMPGNFAALSYCWGDGALLKAHPPLTATVSTLPSLQSGIPITSLPLTLRQSVQIASLLSIPFIWIDSICIIQDSRHDWEVEAAKMETVYAKAKLTIIAASSSSCHSGFLTPFCSSPNQTIVSTPEPLPNGLQLAARLLSNTGYHSPSNPVDPIDYRGWTYQEEHLSTRYVKFTSDDIQWKCHAGTICVCGMRPADEYTWQWKENLEPMARWERTAQKFSARRFTVWSDKLVALSSLARRFAGQILAGGESKKPAAGYLGGIWERELVSQLTWAYPRDQGAPRCSEEYIAPSWSWASINCEVPLVWEPKFDWELAEVVECGRELAFEGNEFGKVSGGFVELRGPVFGCMLKVEEGGGLVVELDLKGVPFEATVRSAQLDCSHGGSNCCHSFASKEAFILLLGGVTRMINECWIFGLILGVMDGSEGYQRLGLLSLITEREASRRKGDLSKWTRSVTIY